MEPEKNVDIDQMIKTAVEQAPVEMTPEEKKDCEKMMREVIENGKTFAEVLGVGNEVLEGFYSAGYLLFNSGKYKEAENVFEVLCRLDASRWKYWYGRAASAHKLKKYERAKDYYMSWAFIEPENPVPFYHASDCCLMLDQKRDAILFLYIVIRLCGDIPEFQKIKLKSKVTQDSLKEQVGWDKKKE